MSEVRRAEIAGAGLAGLTAAAVLAQRGWKVRVHEKGPELREIGAGIFLWENALRVLEKIGAYEEVAAKGELVERHQLRDHVERVLQDDWLQGDWRLRTSVRGDLHGAIARVAADAGAEVVTNSRVVEACPAGELVLQSGQRLRADLIIGADGVFSAVRESLGLTKRMVDLEDGCGRHLINRRPGDPVQRTYEIWSGGRRLGIAPSSREKVYVFLCCPAADTAGMAQEPFDPTTWVETYPGYRDLIERIPRLDDGRWATFHDVVCSSWSKGRVALIGDAAHAMSPNLGQGACMAMTNALALAQAADSSPTIEAALERWECSERPIVDRAQRFSYWYGAFGTRWPSARPMLDVRSAMVWGLGKSKRFQVLVNGAAAHEPHLDVAVATV
jgi:2-polyprenyl-6-methoxyphenol hydroxylase-like FAD-dependent oxidoreductase